MKKNEDGKDRESLPWVFLCEEKFKKKMKAAKRRDSNQTLQKVSNGSISHYIDDLLSHDQHTSAIPISSSLSPCGCIHCNCLTSLVH